LVELGWGVWLEKPVRLMRIDSWELSEDSRQLAMRAAARVTECFGMTKITIDPKQGGPDLHGRIRAEVTTTTGNLSDWLVASGLAWYRKPKKPE
jgi:endonuclease YncB( thermonuclease family)